MGSALVCSKIKRKKITNQKIVYDIFCKNLDDYLKNARNKQLITNLDSEQNKIFNTKNNTNKNSDCESDLIECEKLVFLSKKRLEPQNKDEKLQNFLKTGKLPRSKVKETFNLQNLQNITLEMLSIAQQAKIKSVNNTNLLNCVSFPKIQNELIMKENTAEIDLTDISEKTNFRIVYNKNMQDVMNNLFFPNEYKSSFPQRNTINFTANSISFRDLPVPINQLSITTSNINGGPHIMEISNMNNLNFNTQPNEDLFSRRRTINFNNINNFNKKIKNYILETDKISSCNNETSSNNLGSLDLKRKESIASKTLKQFYDKIFMRNSIRSNEPGINQSTNNLNNINLNTYYKRKSLSPQGDFLRRPTVFSNNISFTNNLPKTALYTIEDCINDDCYYSSNALNLKNINTNQSLKIAKKERDKELDIKPSDKLARKLYYSLEVRSRILEKKDQERELMMRSLSELEEEYNQIQEELNPIFNIKSAIEDTYRNDIYKFTNESKGNLNNFLGSNKRNFPKIKNNKNLKKGPIFEINMKDLIKETINERILTENNKDKSFEKSKIIKFKNLNINNININIQSITEGNYSSIYRKNPKVNSAENMKENFMINASSEFINSIDTLTNINNTNFDRKSTKNNNKFYKNVKHQYSKKNLNGYSNKSLKNKYSNLSSSKKILLNQNGAFKNNNYSNNFKNISKKYNDNIKINDYTNNNISYSKLSNNNRENIFSNIVIESPIINTNSINYSKKNIINSNNKLENINIPTIPLQERNSCLNNSQDKNTLNTLANNLESLNNFDERKSDFDKNKSNKNNKFTFKKEMSNSLISESKTYTDSDLVSSFDSKELASLQDVSTNNLKNYNNKSNDINLYFNNDRKISENDEKFSENISYRNKDSKEKLDEYNGKKNIEFKNKEIDIKLHKRNTIEVIPKFSISKNYNIIFRKKSFKVFIFYRKSK